ncbi:MAG: hypothetical protein E5X80_05950 [Mesorhizobium sp.]|uniref:DUF5801 repeats-in-toxin domain-containing protein n=1 Tax=Mesorhizobium sp. TaxID=1871066 RepID=UPI00120A304D|nr:DUF5801 repeats-in-toxin domain-containing protein [Mesorhizobium sp.]TIO52734.1 MAG: hypothetical protein E5X78_12005 [Mesorhizobium sp.]TIO61619.1 MAG: hypothetical protein E5X79_06045 [Mesorhizobium sp.]TJV66320.1 MAG: hypothetical protein E5X80_05950 [Mesorhizobium sp.]
MTISFILNDPAVNDQTAGPQTDDSGDGFTDTDVAYSTLPLAFRTYLETTLGLPSTFPTNVYVATKTNSVTVNATAGSQLSGTTFTDSTGGALDGDDSLLKTADGKEIFLYADGSNTVIGKYDSDGINGVDSIAFVIFKQDVLNAGATSDQVTLSIVTYVPIFHSDTNDPDDAVNLGNTLKLAAGETTTFSFAGAPSGSNLFMMFGDPNSTEIVVIGQDPLNQSEGGNITTKDVLNISQAGSTTSFGVNGNQINPTEGAFITYVHGANTNYLVPNLDQNEADIEANIDFQSLVNATTASFTVNQTNPGIGPVTVKISAFTTAYEPGTGFVDGLTNDTHVDISSFSLTNVVVKTGNTQYFPDATIDGNGNLIITGLSTGDTVSWTTTGTHNRVLIENISDNDGVAGNDNNTFDIGGFSIATPSSASTFVGQQIVIEDDGPTAALTENTAKVLHDETTGVDPNSNDQSGSAPAAFLALGAVLGWAASASAVVTPSSSFGTDGPGSQTLSLGVSAANADSGFDSLDGHNILLNIENGLVVGRVDVGNDGSTIGDPVALAISISQAGILTIAQYIAIAHPDTANPDDVKTMTDSALLAKVHAVDADGDSSDTSLAIGDKVQIRDDGPTITVPFDGDPGTAGIQHETLANTLNASASGAFGYDIGTDAHTALFYSGGGSDFVDVNNSLAAVQISLTGTVDNAQNPNITQAVATLTAETSTSASFDFSFHYDKDPITAGVQDSTAGGTLVFDKNADTYTITLTDVIDGFSFDVLHTAELIAKQPTGNTGHPLIVAEQLTPNGDPDPFFVQFTANSTTNTIGFGFNSTGDGAPVGDTTFNNGGATHDMVTNLHEDWVSATQSTNGVAGDTIQKGEALTLRFFKENILSDVDPNAPDGGTERLDPTASASGVVVKFDGIGNSEDLVVILDLKDANGNEITRAVNVENSDLIKGNANVPAPYNSEFTLDNNDALLIIEQNDYTVAGETYKIQGLQIMQSANGLTGDAINLNGAVGANGGSSATSNLTAWDTTDNDVLKIVDIGFVQQSSGTIGANLDFGFQIADADGDTTATQHILVDIA